MAVEKSETRRLVRNDAGWYRGTGSSESLPYLCRRSGGDADLSFHVKYFTIPSISSSHHSSSTISTSSFSSIPPIEYHLTSINNESNPARVQVKLSSHQLFRTHSQPLLNTSTRRTEYTPRSTACYHHPVAYSLRQQHASATPASTNHHPHDHHAHHTPPQHIHISRDPTTRTPATRTNRA